MVIVTHDATKKARIAMIAARLISHSQDFN